MGDELVLVRRFQFCNSWIVSTLASCGRLPVTVPDLANRPQQLVFLTPIDSQLNDFLNEIHQIACFEPSIVEHIEPSIVEHIDEDWTCTPKRSIRRKGAPGLIGTQAHLRILSRGAASASIFSSAVLRHLLIRTKHECCDKSSVTHHDHKTESVHQRG